MIYLITYDLNKPGQNYKGLYDAIKNASDGSWMHYLDSTWIIRTNLSTKQVCDRIKPCVDNSDNFLVVEIKENYYGWLPNEAWDYFKKMF